MDEPRTRLRRLLEAMGVETSDEKPIRARDVGVFSLGSVASPGDHIAIRRCDHMDWQHAIFVGYVCDELAVIELGAAAVQLTSFEGFMEDHRTLDQSVIILYDSPDADASKYRALCRAFAVVNREQLDCTPLTTTSASFAIWCMTGSSDHRLCERITEVLLAAPAPDRHANKGAGFSWSQLIS